jgi:hypothetical protein
MRHRTLSTPPPPSETDLDTPEMVEAAAAAERGDQDALVLAEIVEIGMRLMRAQEAYATARLAALAAEGAALNPGEAPTIAYDKIAQTVRRTLALKKQLAADVEVRRAGLAAERAARRQRRREDHKAAVDHAIGSALVDALEADLVLPDFDPKADPRRPEPYEVERDEMLDDAESLLEEPEAFGDYLTRPVGETVARLCAALGLAPDACTQRDGVWIVRRPDTGFETLQARKRAEGPTVRPSGRGSVDETPRRC